MKIEQLMDKLAQKSSAEPRVSRMYPSDLGKPVIISQPDGEATGMLVGYAYSANPTVNVKVGDCVFKNVPSDHVRLAE